MFKSLNSKTMVQKSKREKKCFNKDCNEEINKLNIVRVKYRILWRID